MSMTKNVREVLSPLLITSYVFGLRIVESSTSQSRWFSHFYMLLLWSFYYIFFYNTAAYSYYTNSFPILYRISYWMNNCTTLLLIVFGMYHDKKFRNCLKKLAIVDVTLEKLGTTTNYQQLYTKIIWLISGWFVIAVSFNCVQTLLIKYHSDYDIITAMYVPFVINYCSHLNLLDDLIMISILRYIELKFDQINECLQNLENNNERRIKQAWENPLLHSSQLTFSKTLSSHWVLWTIMHLHSELCKISREIDWIFGTQTTFKMGCHLSFMALNLNELFNLFLLYYDYTLNYDIIIISSILITWLFYQILILFLINDICERVSAKANATRNFVDRVSYSTSDVETYENISQLLLQMTQSPLKFYGLGFFQFGFKFLRGFITCVMTVIVILIQAKTNKKS